MFRKNLRLQRKWSFQIHQKYPLLHSYQIWIPLWDRKFNGKKNIDGNQKKKILKKNTRPYNMTRVNEDFYGKIERMESVQINWKYLRVL